MGSRGRVGAKREAERLAHNGSPSGGFMVERMAESKSPEHTIILLASPSERADIIALCCALSAAAAFHVCWDAYEFYETMLDYCYGDLSAASFDDDWEARADKIHNDLMDEFWDDMHFR